MASPMSVSASSAAPVSGVSQTRHAVARSLTEGARGKTGDALRTFVRETLFSAAPAATEAELLALTELVAAYLSSLSGT